MKSSLRKKLYSEGEGGPNAIVYTLSLFIMLLCFFMIMNAHSSFDDARAQPILKSLEETFTARVFRNDAGPATREDPEGLTGEGQAAIESVDAYFRSTFPGIAPRLIPSRGIYYVELPLETFEKKFFDKNSTLQKTLLEKLWAYDNLQMEIWLNIQNDPGETSATSSKDMQGLVLKTSRWASTLEAQGLKPDKMTIGLQKGKPDVVTVLFLNYKPYAPTP